MQKKVLIALILIIVFAVLILSVPQLIGNRNVASVLSISALVLISIYIVLSLEIIHRGSLALLGATVIVSAAIGFGALQPEEFGLYHRRGYWFQYHWLTTWNDGYSSNFGRNGHLLGWNIL